MASLYCVASVDEALKIANQTRFGLSSNVWSTDTAEQEYCINGLDAGAVFVNGFTASYNELPFGGVKASGLGREGGPEGIHEYLETKYVMTPDPLG